MIPFLDLRAQHQQIKNEIEAAVSKVMDSAQFVLGPDVAAFEERFADYCNVKHCVALNTGTSALHLALLAAGIGPGDEVITTSLSWIATANAISLTGATPVFADVRDDLNIDPESVRRLIVRRHVERYQFCSILTLTATALSQPFAGWRRQ